ncbi:MAG: hypothetical protein PUE39_07765 [bacterium]|nr:hypothetical protein [bacterium]
MTTFWLRPFLGVQQCSCKHGIAFTVGVKSPQLRTQSGESGNTLKIKCSGTADERANTFPCLQRPKLSAAANVR